MIIYCALNTVNGKRYIGLTNMGLRARWSAHVSAATGGSTTILHRAIRKYGAESFVVEEVAHLLPGLDFAALCNLERDLIAQENTMRPHGYNMTAGGEGMSGYLVSDERKVALSAELKAGRAKAMRAKVTPEGSERMRAKRIAYWTDDKRAEQAERARGKKQSEETKRKRFTPEARAKIAEARRGTTLSQETKAKLSKVLKGRKPSPQTIAASKAAYADPEKRAARIAKSKASWTPEKRAANAARMSATIRAFHAAKRAKNEVIQ